MRTTKKDLAMTVGSILRSSGQVMFQPSVWTGLLFLTGIFWGAYHSSVPSLAYGAVVGLIASNIAGWLISRDKTEGYDGLWGFNGILVGCAFPIFLGQTWQMWIALVLCSMLTTWVRTGLNNVMASWKVNSLTFPFVMLTWIFLLASRMMAGLSPEALSEPVLIIDLDQSLDISFGSLVVYWLKGISQVFLIDSWGTGILFLIGLAICSRWAAFWAALASAIALVIAISFGANSTFIAAGLFGFSPVLTGIAVGCTFNKPSLKNAAWTIAAVITTVFIQAAMNTLLLPFGLPTLTAPFCLATWLFLLPQYKFN